MTDQTMPPPAADGASAPRDPAPECPTCRLPMRIRTVEPLMFTRDVDHMTYRCETCATEIKRAVKRK